MTKINVMTFALIHRYKLPVSVRRRCALLACLMAVYQSYLLSSSASLSRFEHLSHLAQFFGRRRRRRHRHEAKAAATADGGDGTE